MRAAIQIKEGGPCRNYVVVPAGSSPCASPGARFKSGFHKPATEQVAIQSHHLTTRASQTKATGVQPLAS